MTIEELRTKKVVVLGLGVNNQALVRYLVLHGVPLVVRERSQAVQEAFAADFPEAASITWEINDKTLEKLEYFEVIFRSPGIPFLSPQLQKALKRGSNVTSQTKLFFDLCPAEIIGVTGSKGKGTTTSLIHGMLETGYSKGKTYLAGNIGADPFSFLEKLTSNDLVVLELSSFQLQDLHRSPQTAVMLGVTPDHQDHHRSFAEYAESKSNLLRFQEAGNKAIVFAGNTLYEEIIRTTPATVYRYGAHRPSRQSAWADSGSGEEVVYVQLDDSIESFSIAGRKLLGEHNLENILPAVLVASLYGVPILNMQKVIREFKGLPHRLSLVGQQNGTQFFDDSIATTPEPCIAAIRTFAGRRVHLIAGGSDKGTAYQGMAAVAAASCVTVSLLPGEASLKMRTELKQAIAKNLAQGCIILDSTKVVTGQQSGALLMETVLSGINVHLQPGDVVLLSPAAASFASFSGYKERGECFIQAVRKRYFS